MLCFLVLANWFFMNSKMIHKHESHWVTSRFTWLLIQGSLSKTEQTVLGKFPVQYQSTPTNNVIMFFHKVSEKPKNYFETLVIKCSVTTARKNHPWTILKGSKIDDSYEINFLALPTIFSHKQKEPAKNPRNYCWMSLPFDEVVDGVTKSNHYRSNFSILSKVFGNFLAIREKFENRFRSMVTKYSYYQITRLIRKEN